MSTELSASTTFFGKYDKTGGTISGRVNRDPQFYFDLNGQDPRINFAAGAHLDFNRSASTLGFTLGDASSPVVKFGAGTGRKYIAFDDPTRIEFVSNSTATAYVFYIGNTAVMSIDGNGNMKLRGTVQQNQTSIP
jgi:hypothetical protein